MEYKETQTSLREFKNLRTKRDTPVKSKLKEKKGSKRATEVYQEQESQEAHYHYFY